MCIRDRIDEYIDDGWSGTNFDRPSFQRMIEDIEAGKINCVVTKDLSRLGRNYIMTGQYTELYFPSHNVRYIAIDDGVDSEKGESEIAPFKNIINEWVARDTSRKVKSAFKTKFAEGAHYGAYAPLGYKKHPDIKGKLLVDEETKWIVEKIFSLAYQGYGLSLIHIYAQAAVRRHAILVQNGERLKQLRVHLAGRELVHLLLIIVDALAARRDL